MRSEKYFSFVEQEGIDRRHAILEVITHEEFNGGHYGEVFDTVTGQTLWFGPTETNEEDAEMSAEIVLDAMENIRGFGSISLKNGGS
ncbi:MAG: hypothetical protein ACR2QI_04130 [Woeseiaceae bacterium]